MKILVNAELSLWYAAGHRLLMNPFTPQVCNLAVRFDYALLIVSYVRRGLLAALFDKATLFGCCL